MAPAGESGDGHQEALSKAERPQNPCKFSVCSNDLFGQHASSLGQCGNAVGPRVVIHVSHLPNFLEQRNLKYLPFGADK